MDNSEINIKLHGVELISSSLNQRPATFQGTTYNFNIRVDTRLDIERKLIVSLVKVEITEVQNKDILYSISVAIGIEVLDFEKVIKPTQEKEPIIPQQLDAVVKTVSISTTRGVMYSELRGTYLHNAFLPIILQTVPSTK